MKWVEVVQVVVAAVAAVVVALAVAVDAGRAGWVAPRLPGRAETVFAPTAGIGHRTSLDSPVTRRSAHSVAHR